MTAIPVTTLFFLTGVAFAWFIMIPAAFTFLRDFQGQSFQAEWTAQNYFAFLTMILFWMGVAFEMPVIFYVLAKLGLVSQRMLIKNWRAAIVVNTIIAAVITPTVDPFNMLLVMIPLLGLYLVSIVMVGIAARGNSPKTQAV
jgi:sec-independent protein translocase protein TatC